MGRTIGTVARLSLVALAAWGFACGRRDSSIEPNGDRPVDALSRVSEKPTEGVVQVDQDAQTRSGILVAALEHTGADAETEAYGMVLDIGALADLRNSDTAAVVEVRKGQASLQASRPEYERIKALYEDGGVVSIQMLQAAEATLRTDEASLEAAEALVRSIGSKAGQDWGPVVGRWITVGSPELERLLLRDDILVQVTLPPGEHVSSPPKSLLLQGPGGPPVTAALVSAASRTDPRIQGQSYFYIAPARPSLLSGMNVSARLATGHESTAVIVPASAIVWLQGKAWVYEQTAPTTFTRREIPSPVRESEIRYRVDNLARGTLVVVGGAQALLSEEFRAQTGEAGEEEEEH